MYICSYSCCCICNQESSLCTMWPVYLYIDCRSPLWWILQSINPLWCFRLESVGLKLCVSVHHADLITSGSPIPFSNPSQYWKEPSLSKLNICGVKTREEHWVMQVTALSHLIWNFFMYDIVHGSRRRALIWSWVSLVHWRKRLKSLWLLSLNMEMHSMWSASNFCCGWLVVFFRRD